MEVDILLIYRIDRLARSIVGLMEMSEQLGRPGVGLKSVTEPIDTHGPPGRMMLQILGVFAEFERNMIIDRVTAGHERRAARGEWGGGRAPLGYVLENGALKADPDGAELVRQMFDKYTEDLLGGPAISNWLNETGRRSPDGKLWSGSRVLAMLKNPVYIGKIKLPRRRVACAARADRRRRQFEKALTLRAPRAERPAAALPTTVTTSLPGS